MPSRHDHTMINVWTRYGEPRLDSNGETDLITNTSLPQMEKQNLQRLLSQDIKTDTRKYRTA